MIFFEQAGITGNTLVKNVEEIKGRESTEGLEMPFQ